MRPRDKFVHRMVIRWAIYGGRNCRGVKYILICPSWESNQGRWNKRQTFHHVAVQASFHGKAVEVYLYIPRHCDNNRMELSRMKNIK